MLIETELKKLEKFDAAYFRGKNYFDDDGTQNNLVFQPVYRYFERVGNNISSWESKGLSNEKISSTTTTSNNKFATSLIYLNDSLEVKFKGDVLKPDKVTYNHEPIVNIYFVYKSIPDTKDSGITLENGLLGAVRLTGYGIGFDSRGSFSHPSGGYGRNVGIFGADMSSSAHANNKTRSILVLGKDFIQGIDNTIIYAGNMYSPNFTIDNKKLRKFKIIRKFAL